MNQTLRAPFNSRLKPSPTVLGEPARERENDTRARENATQRRYRTPIVKLFPTRHFQFTSNKRDERLRSRIAPLGYLSVGKTGFVVCLWGSSGLNERKKKCWGEKISTSARICCGKSRTNGCNCGLCDIRKPDNARRVVQSNGRWTPFFVVVVTRAADDSCCCYLNWGESSGSRHWD